MKLKVVALLVVVTFLGFSLSGCGSPPPPPPPQAKVMVFEEVALFDFDKADLKPEGKEQIKKYREEVQAEMSRADKIKITGYTDSTGDLRITTRSCRCDVQKQCAITWSALEPTPAKWRSAERARLTRSLITVRRKVGRRTAASRLQVIGVTK